MNDICCACAVVIDPITHSKQEDPIESIQVTWGNLDIVRLFTFIISNHLVSFNHLFGHGQFKNAIRAYDEPTILANTMQ